MTPTTTTTTTPPPTILITGATGFTGHHVAHEAKRQQAHLRLMTHRRPVSGPDAAVRTVRADLTDPGTLHGLCDGVDILIHCAAQIGGMAEANEAVNARGTTALLAEAHRAGVRRIVHLSTASVYGRGTYRGSRPEELTRRPGSATSRTRAVAEDAVLAAGGVVLRPHLIYGNGDLWMGQGMARLLRALPGTVAGWTSRMSMIAAPDLARLLTATALAPRASLTTSIYHAAHPEPVTAHTALRAIADCARIPWPTGQLTLPQARATLTDQNIPPSVLDMLTTDHVFEATTLWSDLRLTPGDGFDTAFHHAAPWYRTTLPTT
ncbi:NAD-dependent epimerase/dehydratase family protein [Streptomyces sp. NPDC048389]|uniref:NAD-dependent epimerase/dehydratase family protein n=1 Tax=Streptomyces sp. NPDC048389 TaxID=3154622 RepID=UPI003452D661